MLKTAEENTAFQKSQCSHFFQVCERWTGYFTTFLCTDKTNDLSSTSTIVTAICSWNNPCKHSWDDKQVLYSFERVISSTLQSMWGGDSTITDWSLPPSLIIFKLSCCLLFTFLLNFLFDYIKQPKTTIAWNTKLLTNVKLTAAVSVRHSPGHYRLPDLHMQPLNGFLQVFETYYFKFSVFMTNLLLQTISIVYLPNVRHSLSSTSFSCLCTSLHPLGLWYRTPFDSHGLSAIISFFRRHREPEDFNNLSQPSSQCNQINVIPLHVIQSSLCLISCMYELWGSFFKNYRNQWIGLTFICLYECACVWVFC